MAILTTVACLIGILHPQDPGTSDPDRTAARGTGPGPAAAAASVSDSVIHHARALPKAALLVMALNPVGRHRTELDRTGLRRLFDEQTLPEQASTFLAQLADSFTQASGLEQDQLDQLWQNGVTLALTNIAEGRQPGWLSVVTVGDLADDVVQALVHVQERVAERGGQTRTEEWQGTTLWSSRIEEFSVAYAVHDELLIAGSTRTEVQAALDRVAGRRAEDSLLHNPGYLDFEAESKAQIDGQPLVAAFCNVRLLVPALLGLVPSPHRQSIAPWIDHLQLSQIHGLGFYSSPADGQVHDHFLLGVPEPRSGLLGALLPPPRIIDPALNSLAPDGISAFSLTHVRINGLFEEVMKVLGGVDPSYPDQARMALEMLKRETGVDLEHEILPSLGERIVTMQWPDSENDVAVLIELRNAQRLGLALSRVQSLRKTEFEGFDLYVPTPRSGITEMPGLAIGNSSLLVSSRSERTRILAQHIANPKSNTKIEALLASLPPDTIGAGWSDLRETMAGNFKLLEQLDLGGNLSTVRKNIAALAQNFGELRYTMTSSRRGVAVDTQSPTGSVGGILYTFATTALFGLAEQMGFPSLAAMEEDSRTKDLRRYRTVLDNVAAALHEQHQHGDGEYADLEALVLQGYLDPEQVGDRIDSGVYRIDDHLVTVLLPQDADTRSKHFAVVVWPADAATGLVYARTDDGRPLVNELLALTNGIDKVGRRDVFVGGEFGKELTPGWRDIHAKKPATNTQKPVAKAGTTDRKVYERLLQLEKIGGATAAPELLGMLDSASDQLKARVCYAVGKLKITEATPRLSELVIDYPDLDVRRQAMAALGKLRDPRSLKASQAALESDDGTLRALAAGNLGRIGDKAGIEPLLRFLASADNDPSGADRTQALLALADIGETSVLLQAAGSGTGGDAAQESALGFLFQTLSQKLPKEDEATTLMAVLDHDSMVLRRYAIQRLGELRDPRSVRALEGRLAQEGPQLRGLLEVTLSEVRGDSKAERTKDFLEKAQQTWSSAKARALKFWNGLDEKQQQIAMGGAAGGLLVLLVLVVLIRRRRRRARGADWASMVAPSAGFDDSDDAEAYEAYEGDEEYAESAESADGEGYDDQYADTGVADGAPGGSYDSDRRR